MMEFKCNVLQYVGFIHLLAESDSIVKSHRKFSSYLNFLETFVRSLNFFIKEEKKV